MRHPEPAFIGQETVHIAEKISEIRSVYPKRLKGAIPEIAGTIVFTDTNDKSISRLKVNRDLSCELRTRSVVFKVLKTK